MKHIIGSRGTGKSTLLLKESALNGFTIVTLSQSFIKYLIADARTFKLTIPKPISFRDFINGNYDKSTIKGFLIDDVNLLLKDLATVEIYGMVVNIDRDYDRVVF